MDEVALFRISIHALREEGDEVRQEGQLRHHYFYPRPPRGGRPFIAPQYPRLCAFLSTPSARRATHFLISSGVFEKISIHALREEGDLLLQRILHGPVISIHALREEGDFSFLC